MTCKRFRSLASADSLWEPICRREWGGGRVNALIASFTPQERQRLSWKWLYAQVSQLSSLSCRRLSSRSGGLPSLRASHSLNLVLQQDDADLWEDQTADGNNGGEPGGSSMGNDWYLLPQ
ncbi:F-box/kelch-repeat protein [Canna indica]|uniref:F-box/kelch-repeat protein n=1 Tax=Canna indica TaxID=4628 RepID=A0AAQ3KPB6_9LILI|nr:F-box/kelch-repeat protein [Canna indica]